MSTSGISTPKKENYIHDYLIDRLFLWAIPPQIKPNHITVLRFILTIPVVWLVFFRDYDIAAALFIFAALTDAIDGSLARTRDQITEWGELFDPVADKLLVGVVGLILIFRFLHWLLIVTILVLEGITITMGFIYKLKNPQLRIRSNIFGKIKMVLQVTAVVLLFIFTQFPFYYPLSALISLIFVASIFFTLLSMYYAGI